jgi:1,4-dihydroxy-2-naphthoyl-CoA hydrolase
MDIRAEDIYEYAPFAATLGVQFPELSADRVTAVLPARREVSMLGSGLHGGAIMSVCDLASAVCVALNIEAGSIWTTAESSTHFLRPVHSTATVNSDSAEARKNTHHCQH